MTVATVGCCLTAPPGFKVEGIRAEGGWCPENELPQARQCSQHAPLCPEKERWAPRRARQPGAVINPVRSASAGEAELRMEDGS